MSWSLLLLLALVTVASRVLPMTLLPVPHGRAAEILEALPAPLFAGLAALALVGGDDPPSTPVLLAAGGALLGATRRSLGLTLICGVTAFLVGGALLE